MCDVLAADSYSAKDKFSFSNNAPSAPTKLSEFVCIIVRLIMDVIPFIFALAVFVFLAGLIKYVGNGDNEEKRSEGRSLMTYGIIGFFVMVSVWGLVGIFTGSLGMSVLIPQFNGGSQGAFVCNPK